MVAVRHKVTQKAVKSNTSQSEGKKTRSRAKNADLPKGSFDRWLLTFIPTFLAFFGNSTTPWLNSDQEILAGMQTIWDQVYPNIPYEVVPGQAVHGKGLKAIQKLYDWRRKIGATGVSVVAEFFNSDPQYAMEDSRAEYVRTALSSKKPFIFAQMEPNTPHLSRIQKRKGPFRSKLILEVFAQHLFLVSDYADLDRSGDINDTVHPCGALALSAVAVRTCTLSQCHSDVAIKA
ncbi:hypothetical protein B0H21DRAFT_686318 [Amylocystis lapponica]|nr:hypothetical protein B0H21DRAFT_686318 [Amylocystis lapponica]